MRVRYGVVAVFMFGYNEVDPHQTVSRVGQANVGHHTHIIKFCNIYAKV